MFVRFITGDDLRRARLSVNFSTKEMARKLGVSRITLENWENEISQPKINQALEFLTYARLNVQPLLQQLEALKELFDSCQDGDSNKPNLYRASKKKNHLQQAKPLTDDTITKELNHANENIDCS
ncbi:helix-turn-helix domain-containing protein [Thalassomonas actiniarum]|uniref:Helix-turn-helix domain-containing protein n=1 Tax=Thalassomonas actiniarum TaxID=485447 RepID=A0AAE9YQU2_9GAMM|nr:helix-turn-helix transcriptional regulator [Thalassomonas actiniarum]WDD97877.1 helix-turn-helix domain-containing protein [Thalassomonas actiniarum]